MFDILKEDFILSSLLIIEFAPDTSCIEKKENLQCALQEKIFSLLFDFSPEILSSLLFGTINCHHRCCSVRYIVVILVVRYNKISMRRLRFRCKKQLRNAYVIAKLVKSSIPKKVSKVSYNLTARVK